MAHPGADDGTPRPFAILGNHDYNYGDQEVPRRFARTASRPRSQRGSFTFGGHAIDVVGLPDAHIVRRRCSIAGVACAGPATIVLTHDPVWFKDVPLGPI